MNNGSVQFDAKKITDAKRRRPYTTKGLADDTGLTRTTIYKALRGGPISPDTARRICDQLEVKWPDVCAEES